MKIITLDLETAYSREYSLSKMTTEEYVTDPRFQVIGVGIQVDNGEPVWHPADKNNWHLSIASEIAPYRISSNAMLCHNMMFDGLVMEHHFGVVPKMYLDTMLMARPHVFPTLAGGSLKKLADYFGLPPKGTAVHDMLGKWREDFTDAELDSYGEYCKHDTRLTYKLFKLIKDIGPFPPQELRIIDRTLRMYLQPKLRLDCEALAINLNETRQAKQHLLSNLPNGIEKADLTSANRFAAALRALGVEPPKKISERTKKEAYAFAKTDPGFKELQESEDVRVQALCAARLGHTSTQAETRAKRLLDIGLNTGHLRVPLAYHSARTGRYGGTQKINLQNLKRGSALRRAIVPPPDHVIMAGDLSQIEARIVATLAGQTDLMEVFRTSDPYCDFASKLFNKPINKEDNPAERFFGKTCILGLGYGMGAETFLSTCIQKGIKDVDEAKARETVNFYRDTYGHIQDYWYRSEHLLKAMRQGIAKEWGPMVTGPGYLLLPNGLRLMYNDLTVGHDGWSYTHGRRTYSIWGAKLVENFVQALARTIIMDMMLKVSDVYPVLMQAHDELIIAPHVNAVSDAAAYMTEVMSTPPVWLPELPIACEIAWGKNYGECK